MKRSVRLLALLLCLTLCMSFTVFATDDPQDVWGDVKQDNFVRITSSDAWNKGTYENTVLTEEVGNGAIRLAEGQLEGSWVSQEMDVPAFEYMVASWSADTPKGASVEIMVNAYVDMKSEWTGWMSWGKWGIGIKRGSADTSNALAYVDTDILTIKGSSGETASRIQVKAVLRTVEGGKTPTLRDISATSKNTLEGQSIPIYYPNAGIELPVLSDWDYALLDVAPCRYSGSIPNGNMILMGHNYKSHFAPLRRTAAGDSVEFVDVNGRGYRYTVDKVDILHKNDGELLPSEHPLILFTCTTGGQDRIVVRCLPVE